MKKPELSDFLTQCIENRVVDEATAVRLQRYARSAGVGVIEAVEDLGLMSRGDFVERVLHALSSNRTYFPLLLQREPAPARSFDNYYCFKKNYPALKSALGLAEGRHQACGVGPVVIVGDHGMGKTHLLSATVKKACLKDAIYYHCMDLEAEIERAERLGCRADLRQRLISGGLVALDDFHRMVGKKGVQHEVIGILDRLIAEEKGIIIASSIPPEDLDDMEEELKAKISTGVKHTLHMGEEEERKVLLEKLDEAKGLPDEVRDYLAINVKESVRHLKAALLQIQSMCGDKMEDASVEMARAVVPLPVDLDHSNRTQERASNSKPSGESTRAETDTSHEATRFKKMMQDAENEEEQALALQIALNQRLRELREAGEAKETIRRFEGALELLRAGRVEEAIKSIAT